MMDSMVELTESTIAHYEPKVEDHTAELEAARKAKEAEEEQQAIKEARNELLELEPVPIEKNQLMLENIINQHSSDNVNDKMLELMEDNSGENTVAVEISTENQKKEEEQA